MCEGEENVSSLLIHRSSLSPHPSSSLITISSPLILTYHYLLTPSTSPITLSDLLRLRPLKRSPERDDHPITLRRERDRPEHARNDNCHHRMRAQQEPRAGAECGGHEEHQRKHEERHGHREHHLSHHLDADGARRAETNPRWKEH